MISGKSVLAVITARGGSLGLPRKNVLPFRGSPLIAWTIQAALASRHVDRVILSSDDAEIIETAARFGCEAPFVRVPALAGPEAASIDVVLDALDRTPGYEVVVLLQPTSPLRISEDIDGALERMDETGAPAVVSVRPSTDHPWLTFGRDGRDRLAPHAQVPKGASLRRQDLPEAWVLNGAVYAAGVAWLRRGRTFMRPGETALWPMPAERSVDIDTLEDFRRAERPAGG